jgi:DNA repair exonuclease SbcCD ATPase subunit
MKAKIQKVKEVYQDTSTKRTNAQAQISNFRREFGKLNSEEYDDAQTQSLENLIQDGKEKKESAIQKKAIEEKKGNFFRIVEDIFGDKGVKLSALKRIIPLLNAEIRKVLADLNMDYRVTFNEEFDVDIQHLGFKVSPEQLSTGEKKKVDFAALIALIRLMKIRFAGLNLTFLDEIFSSIDADGIHHILKVLHKTCRELNLNIFVINHSQLPTEIFDYRVEISKNNGFSSILLEKIG